MSTMLKLLILVFAVYYVGSTVMDPESNNDNSNDCKKFSRGRTFNESLAIGTWHNSKHWTHNATATRSCYDITYINDQDKIKLASLNLSADNITIKMTTPCKEKPSKQVLVDYLRSFDTDGSYASIQIPQSTDDNSDQLDLSKIKRYNILLKMNDDKYLNTYDCDPNSDSHKYDFAVLSTVNNTQKLNEINKRRSDELQLKNIKT